jgi:hypothetical protein
MITLDLRDQTVTIEELLRIASAESVLIRSNGGQEFILEAADEFEREVAVLGSSEKFMQFLAERSKEPGAVTIEQLKQELEERGE